MADTATTEETSETEETTEQTEEQKPSIPPEVAAALKKANKEAETARRKLKEIEDAGKSETEKLTGRVTDAETRASKAERTALQYRVAAAKGLSPKLAERLSGDTEDEMTEDADTLLAEFGKGKTVPSFEAGARGGGSAPSGGSFLTKAIRDTRSR